MTNMPNFWNKGIIGASRDTTSKAKHGVNSVLNGEKQCVNSVLVINHFNYLNKKLQGKKSIFLRSAFMIFFSCAATTPSLAEKTALQNYPIET